ncbi:hypothetical protein DQ04_02741090 [Trypanosoma grayi]|uniref:hypothetical protein n=1 Tax=Trypanosoma grayi TaxID=71804 RepID=UPI0004F4A56F|nr:hypothetical protein DQ04_02741090 [Trypanosoma grayi]KEG11324.1 hypothetical protein DQ04_02741090 [Trypanosoma grayi]
MYASFEEYETATAGPHPYVVENIGVSIYNGEGCGTGGLSDVRPVVEEREWNVKSLLPGKNVDLCPVSLPLLDRWQRKEESVWNEFFQLEKGLRGVAEEASLFLPEIGQLSTFEELMISSEAIVELEEALYPLAIRLNELCGCRLHFCSDEPFLSRETINRTSGRIPNIMAYRVVVAAADSIAKMYGGASHSKMELPCTEGALKRADEVARLLDSMEVAVDTLESQVSALCAESESRLNSVKGGLDSLS